MSRDERPLAAVPPWVLAALAAALAAQIAVQALRSPGPPRASDLPPAPRVEALHLAAFGEPEAFARLAMLYLQAFDLGGGNELPYARLDYARLTGWLAAILALDRRSDYPLFAASRIYAEVPDPARARQALEFVYTQFFGDPNRRWPALAQAALLAKHRLKDLPLALRYAEAIERYAVGEDVPLWAKQMRIFILEDMNELEAAKIVLGGMLASGRVRDPAEIQFLQRRLEELEARISGVR